MDAADLRKLGAGFSVGEDLYGVSLAQLTERLDILRAEITRIEAEIQKKILICLKLKISSKSRETGAAIALIAS